MHQHGLSPAQLAELTATLQSSLEELGGEIRNERDEVREHVDSRRDAGVQDRGEESVAGSMAAVDRAILQQHEGERRQVQAALARVRDGSYGECQRCGGFIGYERLRAAPAASRCLRCQERAESG